MLHLVVPANGAMAKVSFQRRSRDRRRFRCKTLPVQPDGRSDGEGYNRRREDVNKPLRKALRVVALEAR